MKVLASLSMALAAASLSLPSAAQNVIKIGEVNSFKAQPGFMEPYKRGIDLAVDEINAAGGVDGRTLQVVVRDDNGNPADAVRAAEELVTKERVDLLTGTFLSHVGLAVADFAKQKKMFFLAGEPLTDKLVWQNGNRYTFRLRPSAYMQVAILVPEAARLKKTRWALVYPNYEYGQSAVATFKQLMQAVQPGIEFVAEQATPLGKVEPEAVVKAINDAKPDAIFNVLFGADLAKFVKEGKAKGAFTGREVVSLLTGEPEYLEPLKDDVPEGWLVTGYPWHGVQMPEHKAFLAAYQQRYNDHPRLGSVVGYSMIKSIAAGVRKAGSTDTEKLVAAFRGLEVDTPFGKISYRTEDHQSTMGAFIGRIKRDGTKAVMDDYRYIDGRRAQPKAVLVEKLRPAD